MGVFFSCISSGKRLYYFNWEQRKQIRSGTLKVDDADNHTSIAKFYGFSGAKEDALCRYEYNPLTKTFKKYRSAGREIDISVYSEITKLDWKKICPLLIIKDIVNPFALPMRKPGKRELRWLKQWDSVGTAIMSAEGSTAGSAARDEIRDEVGGAVLSAVWHEVWDVVRYDTRPEVWDEAWLAVWNSVCDSLGDEVGDVAWAYASSFFNIKYKYDTSPAVKLWERGLVPIFDGKFWCLRSGENAEIVWKGKV